jgi:mannitol-1-phosphate 5-dehydrogenase
MNKTVVMFGAGNVGRGFLGQLFSESGYEVIFVDVDESLLDALNRQRAYTIRLIENDWAQEVRVAPVRALHSNQVEEVTEVLAGASLAATAVGARNLHLIAPLAAAGISLRARRGVFESLNFIICENLHDAASVFRGQVKQHIPPEELPYFVERVGFVNTVIGRMVPPLTPEMRQQDPSLIIVEPYQELPVDKAGFVGNIPGIVGMQACDNFSAYTARKLYIHNCGHAMLAYLGYLSGYEYGYQALVDPFIRAQFDSALSEAKTGIMAEYGVEGNWLEAHIQDLTHRFANRALGDTIFRLGRDPLRKLTAQDRLVGAARLAEKAGRAPQAISLGIAAGYCFNPADDPLALELQRRIKAQGFETVLAEVSGIQAVETLGHLVNAHYHCLRP